MFISYCTIKNGKDPHAGKDWRQEEKWMTREWDGWMASPTQWTWLWASFGSWWWTAKAGMLQSMRLQRIGHSWVTELTVHQLILQFQIKYKDSSEKCSHNQFLGQTPHMSALTPDRGFPHASVGRKFTCNTRGCLHAGDPGTISGREDPLEREMATQSNSFAWEIPWTRGAWGATVHGDQSRAQLSD